MEKGNSQFKPFPTTQWSLIVRAGGQDSDEREEALGVICSRYWTPVYAYMRSRGLQACDAEDATQGLFAELIARNDFAKADANVGRLRSYLLTAAKNYLSSEHRRVGAIKRGGGLVFLSIDAKTADSYCGSLEPVDELTPDKIFERQWATAVMESVVAGLEARYEAKGQGELFRLLRGFIMAAGRSEAHDDIGRKLGMTGVAVRVAIHRLRQRYAAQLKEEVKATLAEGEDVEEELEQLKGAFS